MKQCILSALIFAAFTLSGIVMASEITDSYADGDALTSGMMDNIKSAVNDNDSRIQSLESPASTTGRISIDGHNTILDETGTTTYKSVYFAPPADYVSQGSNDVTLKVYFRGCDGSSIRGYLRRIGYSAGSNSTFFIVPTVNTYTIPTPGIYQFYITEVSTTVTGFSEVNYVSFNRIPSDGGDTCTGDIRVLMFVVEYPRDPSM